MPLPLQKKLIVIDEENMLNKHRMHLNTIYTANCMCIDYIEQGRSNRYDMSLTTFLAQLPSYSAYTEIPAH